MRLRMRQLVATFFVGATATYLLSGCTVLGFGAGAAVDQFRPTRYDAHPPEHVTETSLKTPVVLLMRDTTQVAGRYLGVEPDETANGAAQQPSATNPHLQRIVIQGADGSIMRVAVDSIAFLSVAAPKHGKLVGVLIGLGIDITYAVYLAYFAQWD